MRMCCSVCGCNDGCWELLQAAAVCIVSFFGSLHFTVAIVLLSNEFISLSRSFSLNNSLDFRPTKLYSLT